MQTSPNYNNWFKLFALMVVGGIAKSLFAPPAVHYHNEVARPEKREDTFPPVVSDS